MDGWLSCPRFGICKALEMALNAFLNQIFPEPKSNSYLFVWSYGGRKLWLFLNFSFFSVTMFGWTRFNSLLNNQYFACVTMIQVGSWEGSVASFTHPMTLFSVRLKPQILNFILAIKRKPYSNKFWNKGLFKPFKPLVVPTFVCVCVIGCIV